MPRVIISIRELGRQKPDYSLEFDLPEVPAVGSYISIFRPDSTHSEDVIVRQVWWQLRHPELRSSYDASEEAKIGNVRDIMVECDQAIGPYARDRWRSSLEAARDRGIEVEQFNVGRTSFPESLTE